MGGTITDITTQFENATGRDSTLVPFFSQPDETDNVISQDIINSFSLISNAILTPVLCVSGIICHSLGIGVIWWDLKVRKFSAYLYLFALIILDILTMLIGLIELVPWVLRCVDIELAKYIDAHMKLGTVYVTMTLKYSSRAVICVLAWDRIISIIRPLHVVKRMWFEEYPRRIIVICVMLNVILLLPIVVNSEIITEPMIHDTNEYVFQYQNYDDFMKIFTIVQVVIQDIFLMIYLLILTLLIPIKFYFANKKRKTKFDLNYQVSNQRQEEISQIVMLILMLYILLAAPSAVENILALYTPDFNIHGKRRHTFMLLKEINDMLDYLNVAVKFLPFYLVSYRYRLLFKKRYCKFCFKDISGDINMLSQSRRKSEAISVYINGSRFRLNYSSSYPDFSTCPPRDDFVSDETEAGGNNLETLLKYLIKMCSS